MKKHFFRWKGQKPQVAYFKLLGMHGMALRSGEDLNKSKLAGLMGRSPAFMTDALDAMRMHYRAEIERDPAEDGKGAKHGLDIPEFLSDHALHFSLMDFMVREVLMRPEDYSADLVLEICAYARAAVDMAARLAEEMDAVFSYDSALNHEDFETPEEAP